MSALQTFSELHAVLFGAVANAKEELEKVEGLVPVLSADEMEHVSLRLRILAASFNGAALKKRELEKAAKPVPTWWQ